MSVSINDILDCRQLLQPQWAAGVHLLCADADFRAEAELKPIRKARGSVDIDRRRGRTRKSGRSLNTLERKTRGIQSKGRGEGKKMLETSFNEMESSFYKSAEKLLDDLTNEVEL